MVVTVDTQTLIWGVKKVATAGQEDMIPLTSRFLQWLDEQRMALHLTSTVVGEYLAGFPAKQRAAAFAEISTGLPVYSYDLKAASIAAELLHDNKESLKQIQAEFGKTRQCIRSDIAIIATAIASGTIQTIYSNDKGLTKAAMGRIAVLPIPDHRVAPAPLSPRKPESQGKLFGED